MRFAWANTVLFVLLLSLLASGFGGLISGSESLGWLLWLHGIGAYGVVLLLVWKGAVVLGSLRRRRGQSLARVAFMALAALLIAVLATGIIWTVGGRRLVSSYSLITIHVVLALSLLAPLVWHVLHMRFVFRVGSAVGRGAFLRLGTMALGGLGLWTAAGRAMSALALPGALRRFTGSYHVGSLTGAFPVVSWLFDRPVPVEAAEWRLVVEGAVERPLSFTYAELGAMSDAKLRVTLDCTGGWYSEQEWEGVSVGDLLARAGVKPSARSVSFEAVTGYGRKFELEAASGYLLALRVAGQVLDHGHGYPVRLVALDHRGFDWVKWVARVRVEESDALVHPPVPLQ